VEDKTLSLTDQIYQELVDGLKTEQDYTHLRAKYDASKGPFYNALGRLFRDMWPKVQEFNEVQGKLDAAGLKSDQLDKQIKEAESSLAPLEERKSALNEQIETLETKLAEKSEAIKHVGELEKLGFNIERLRQLREALTEIGAKHGLKDKEAVSKFFSDLKDYEAVLGAESLLKGLQTQIETKKLEAENWQAKEEALKRKHDDLKEAIGAVYALRAKGVKASQIPVWQRILDQFGTVEQFEGYLTQYGDITKLLNARKEEAESYELRLTKAKSEVETLEKERAKIEGAIDALKVAGVKELKAMTEATEKQLKAVAASEIKEAQAVGQEVRKEFANYVVQLDKLSEKAVHLGQELERSKQELQKYEGVKNILESHAVAMEEAK
jgi:DNA repair exonuclease SbcCD ATPase subunit